MKRTTVEALGGAQAAPSDLIPVHELHQHLINQAQNGNVMLTDADGVPAAMVMSMTQFRMVTDELSALRRQVSSAT
jgi:hypothetical protein